MKVIDVTYVFTVQVQDEHDEAEVQAAVGEAHLDSFRYVLANPTNVEVIDEEAN